MNQVYIIDSWITFKISFQGSAVMKKPLNRPEEEFPVQGKGVPRWNRLLSQAIRPQYQLLSHIGSKEKADEPSKLWFPSPWKQSPSFLCISI